MMRQNVSLRSAYRVLLGGSLLVGAVLLGGDARADYNIKATEAASNTLVTDAKCNLVEAVDSLNNGKTAANSGLWGCVNAGGGKRIVLEGTGAHYNVGTSITVWANGGMEITSKIANKDFVEGPANQFVIGVQSGSSLTLTGITVQRIGTNKSQVLQNHGLLTVTNSTIQGGDTANDGAGIYNNGDLRLSGSKIQNNKSGGNGGGIFSKSLIGATLTNTTVSGNTSSLSGAGIYGNVSPIKLTTSTVKANTSFSNAGGIYMNTATLTLDQSTIEANTAIKSGGGIYSYQSTLTMNGGKVTGAHTAANGGGLYLSGGGATLTGATIEGATATADGGGIYNNTNLLLVNTTVQNNKATTGNGGGVYSKSGDGISLEGSTISNNTAELKGGGIYSWSRCRAERSTVSTNTAKDKGGGIYSLNNQDGTTYLELYWVTIGYNRGSEGAGVYLEGHANTRTQSSIIAKNSRPNGTTFDDYFGNPHGQEDDTLFEYRSLFGEFLGTLFYPPNVPPNDIQGGSNIQPLANNGGLTKTHAIPANSNALNAAVGNPTCASLKDQRGVTRPVGGACDIGSYERQ